MRLRHSLPPVALGAVALGAALGANPAHADTPSPSRPPLVEVATSPEGITVSVADVVEVQLSVPLPLPTAVVSLPLPVPLPSTDPLPLPSSVPLPTPSAKPSTAPPSRPASTPSSSPQATPAPSASASPDARVASPPSLAPSTPVSATVSRSGAHGTSGGRASEQARATMTAVAGQRPNPPARPTPGLPAFVLALATAPTGVGAGGTDPQTSTAEAPPPTSPLRPGLTVTAVDRRANSRPVERGPPPPQ
ncbi:hypothetical protein [Micromonospora ureilytica]|uniref:hypothetical protein n=1 Tax=Micromonospora ureilytica TaxID=709868 RepID=UPI002E0F3AB8|nr:hypothetical protein OHB55_10905 [Micromonospora ureilytica]